MVQKQLEFLPAAAVILRLLRDSPYSPVGRVYLRNYIKFSRLTGGLGGIRKSRSIRNRFVITSGYEPNVLPLPPEIVVNQKRYRSAAAKKIGP